jgi:uncharacterized membrane protein
MKNRISLTLVSLILILGSFFGCVATSQIVDVGAQVAGAVGVIDSNTAAGISQSAQAIGRAAEEITP